MIIPTLVSIKMTKAPDISAIEAAWRLSRPNESAFNVDDVLAIDVPVNEFADVILEVTAPILLREIICTLREHIVWARTSRVDDLSNWPVWPGVAEDRRIKELKEQYDQSRAAQDQRRMMLPLAYVTGFSLKLSLRTYIKLICMFRKMAMSGNYDVAFRALCREMHNELAKHTEFMPSKVKRIIEEEGYQPLELFDVYVPGGFGQFGYANHEHGIVTVYLPNISIALRAQIVRHRPIIFNDNFPAYFSETGLICRQDAVVQMQLAMSVTTAEALIKKRNCWIAQTDIWREVVEKLNTVVDSESGLSLPCSNGKCPFERDNRLRIEGKDPNPPCPRYANLYDEPLTDVQYLAAAEYAKERPEFNFWKKELKNV